MKLAHLVLESGEVFSGKTYQIHFKDRAGEVVFNTSHFGYEEIATDPSYYSQIIVMTSPMQGNYGASKDHCESSRLWIEGFVCLSIQNSQRERSWQNQLEQAQVPLLHSVDTRALTRRLRAKGTTWGALVMASNEVEALSKSRLLIHARKKEIEKDWVFEASCKEIFKHQGNFPMGPRLGILDLGMKFNILREALHRSSQCIQFPSRTSAEKILSYDLDGLILSNGPGDPQDVQVARETIGQLVGKLPLFGICMGHQILCLALGAETYKLKFGHRGANHPIKDDLLGRIYMTSQNHGYAVRRESLPDFVKVTQLNLNDQTVAGIFCLDKRILGIQYHPESCPGPHDSKGLFDYFISKMI